MMKRSSLRFGLIALGAGLTAITIAASVTSALELEGGTLAGGAQVVADSRASGGKAVKFMANSSTPTSAPSASMTPTPTATATPTPAPSGCTSFTSTSTSAQCGYPSASTTGVPAGTALANQSAPLATGLVITIDGTVINAINLSGWIDVKANNVTIQNSVITSNNWWGIKYESGYSGLKVLRNKLTSVPGAGPDNGGYDYGISQIGTGYMEVAYNDISGYKDGVDVDNGYVHDNYIHGLSQFTGAHTQAVYGWCGGAGVTISHNTLINDTAQAYSTAAFYIAPDCGHQNNYLVDDNWLAGGSLVLYGGDSTATNMRITNNKFSTEIWSPEGGFNGTAGYWNAGGSGNVWSGNIWGQGPNASKTVTAP